MRRLEDRDGFRTSVLGDVVSAARIETCIAGAFTGWSGETVFELCNGDVWVQTEYAYVYQYAYRPNVVIELSSGLGARRRSLGGRPWV